MNKADERIIIEIDKINNRVVYVPCEYNCDILESKQTSITYEELVSQLRDQKNIYYIPYRSDEPMINKNTGEQVTKHLRKERMTTGDLADYVDKKYIFVE